MANDKVTQVLVNRILNTIEKEQKLPWQKPWHYRYAFNYLTQHIYTGINRWLLPVGEYMSANQLNKYNELNNTNYKFKKGIEWYPVLFMKNVKANIQRGDLDEDTIQYLSENREECVMDRSTVYKWSNEDHRVMKFYKCRRFYSVADIKWFVDENGNNPPSKIETGEIIYTIEKPENVVKSYIDRENISLQFDVHNEAFYVPRLDSIHVPPIEEFKSAGKFYSTIYHEMGHSTGARNRLNRKEITERTSSTAIYEISREELVAEMCACLVCVETGIYDIEESETDEFRNSQAYINSWYNRIKSGEEDIVFIASDAEKACKFILGEHIIRDVEEFAEKI